MATRKRTRKFLVEVTEIVEDDPLDDIVHQQPEPTQTREGWFARQWRGNGPDPAQPVEWTPEALPDITADVPMPEVKPPKQEQTHA